MNKEEFLSKRDAIDLTLKELNGEEKWSVENNLYNPTYKQLVEDQQWIKPAIQE